MIKGTLGIVEYLYTNTPPASYHERAEVDDQANTDPEQGRESVSS
jgi:hypothetical protein